MKKIFFLILSVFFLLFLGQGQANAYGVVDTNTFILNGGNDLGKIIPKGTYFTPRIEYTDAKAVQKQFADNLNYPGNFYSSRNIDLNLVYNKNPYFTVSWDRPYFVKSLSGIKRVLRGYLFAYRVKGAEIFWMDAKNFTDSFLTGYKTKKDQSLIIYPIKNNKTRKIVAFIEYPCGNLVCKDTMCSDLKINPVCGDGIVNTDVGEVCDPRDPKTKSGCTDTCQYKELSCKIYSTKDTIYDTQKPSVRVSKDYKVDINKYYLNRTEFKNYSDISKLNLEPGKYELRAVGVNKYSGKEFLCEGDTFTVENKEFCGDGVVSGNEQCDYKDPHNNGTCSRTCKFIGDSCSVKTTGVNFDEPVNLIDILDVRKSKGTKIIKIELNGKDVTNSKAVIEDDGKYEIEVFIKNDYSGSTASCKKNINYDGREYCGDGRVTGYEQCDDSNNENGDGCSKTCRLERPTCSIKRNSYTFDEGNLFSRYINMEYTGLYQIGRINNDRTYSSTDAILSETVQRSVCGGKGSVSYTIANPIDSSLTKTCETTFRVKNKEYCGDGVITNGEQCDPKDPYTGNFCTDTCEFKTTETCNVLNNSFIEGEEAAIVIDTEYFAIPTKLSIDGRTVNAKNGVFKHKFKKAGTYNVTALLSNKVDTRNKNPSYCSFQIKVNENTCNY